MAKFLELQKQAAELGTGTQAKIGDALNRGQEKPKANPNTWVSGRATFRDTPISSVGTTPDVRRSDIKEPSDVRIASRYGSKKTGPDRIGGVIGG